MSGLLLLAGACLSGTHAQTGSNAVIVGRVFSPSTGEYVRNAVVRVDGGGNEQVVYSGLDGSYELTGVTPGSVTVSVDYTGYVPEKAAVVAEAGRTTRRDFDLRPRETIGPGSSVTVLQAMTVSAEREGDAKAIMMQRASVNAMNAVDSDKFGYIGEGNVGEFLKFIPGVQMDFSSSEARNVRINGMDPKYATVTLDGNRVGSTGAANFNNDSRQFDFDQISMSSVRSVEVNKTLTADMDGDSVAGAVKLVSKSALDRKGRQITFQADAEVNSTEKTLARTPYPDREQARRPVRPGGRFGYSDIFFDGRLGVSFSANLASLARFAERDLMNTYNYSVPARGPVLTTITWSDWEKYDTRASMALNLDYRLSEHATLSLRDQWGYYHDEYAPAQFVLNAAVANVDPSSTLTRVVGQATANANTSATVGGGGHLDKIGDTITVAPQLKLKYDTLDLTASASYSRARVDFQSVDQGRFAIAQARLTRMSWMAERSSADSTAWTVTQLSGPDWRDLNNYNRSDAFPNNVTDGAVRDSKNQIFSGSIDAVKIVNNSVLPFRIKTGAKARLTVFDQNSGSSSWTYVGPTGNQLNASMAPFLSDFHMDPKMGGNLFLTPMPHVDKMKLYQAFVANPSQFTPNTFTNFSNVMLNQNDVKEQVDAGYLSLGTTIRGWRLEGGFRYERTRDAGKLFNPIPDAKVTAAGYTANTIPFLLYKYHNGERDNFYNSYGNWFGSAAAKYRISPNLDAQFGFSQGMLRPNFNNLAGAISVNETTRTVTAPNHNLLPEESNKYYTGMQYYLEPAGVLSVGSFILDVNHLQTPRVLTAAEAGYANDPTYGTYDFNTTINDPGRRRNVGMEVEYNQRFTFLPRPFDGLAAFGSLTRIIASAPQTRLIPKAASGGFSYHYGRLGLQLRGTWTGAWISAMAANNEIRWVRERLMIDAQADIALSRRYSLFLYGRNIFDEPFSYYSNEPGRLYYIEHYGVQWTMGIRGQF